MELSPGLRLFQKAKQGTMKEMNVLEERTWLFRYGNIFPVSFITPSATVFGEFMWEQVQKEAAKVLDNQ